MLIFYIVKNHYKLLVKVNLKQFDINKTFDNILKKFSPKKLKSSITKDFVEPRIY